MSGLFPAGSEEGEEGGGKGGGASVSAVYATGSSKGRSSRLHQAG